MPKFEIPGRARAAVCLPAVLLAATGLAACGSSSSGGSSNSASTPASSPRSVASTPSTSTSGTSRTTTGAAKAPGSKPLASKAATTAPRPGVKAPLPRNAAAASAAFRKGLVKFAECLRQNGVKIPMPNTSGKGPIFGAKGIKTNTPQFRAAALKCRTALVAALRPAGARPLPAAPAKKR